MDNLVLLKFILIALLSVTVLCNLADAATKGHKNSSILLRKKHDHNKIKNLQHNKIERKRPEHKNVHSIPKHTKKTKRSTYSRSWKSSSYDSSNNMPPYLVYNRKIGAYYPYFKYPSESNVRRNMRKDSRYN
ncbi:hypothetical protein K1T71_010370 [Dendrolimus kikuchii]|uniref:Uncharacterized protein n=1 Tax=Dendrolimus kikuchii TaxID=765133 RepID=A0ACC1CRB9_9NEOP|nr:hypothetical protein K1T71_010370 [Dendrolimus kikuchii]